MVKLWRWKWYSKLYDLLQHLNFLICRNCTLFGHVSKSKKNKWNINRSVKTDCICKWPQNSTLPSGSKAPFVVIPRIYPEKFSWVSTSDQGDLWPHSEICASREKSKWTKTLHWVLDSSLSPWLGSLLTVWPDSRNSLELHPQQPCWGPWTPTDTSPQISPSGWDLSCSSQKTCL